MAYKVYKTRALKSYSIDIYVGFKRVTVDFTSGFQIGSTAVYGTSNADVQKALEGLKAFGRDFYLYEETPDVAPVPAPAPKVEEKKEEEKPLTDVKDIKRFRNLVEMKSAMRELGLTVKDEWNYTATKAAAAKEGYDFQIKK